MQLQTICKKFGNVVKKALYWQNKLAIDMLHKTFFSYSSMILNHKQYISILEINQLTTLKTYKELI